MPSIVNLEKFKAFLVSLQCGLPSARRSLPFSLTVTSRALGHLSGAPDDSVWEIGCDFPSVKF